MFYSVADVWRNVLTNNADFKELIPEFYDENNNGEFLSNKYGINFGFRSDNTKVGDVELPPWAEGTYYTHEYRVSYINILTVYTET